MVEIWACLVGNWVRLNDDPKCWVGIKNSSPSIWYEENAVIWSSNNKEENTYYQLDFVSLFYKGRTYRINPIFIQIVGE